MKTMKTNKSETGKKARFAAIAFVAAALLIAGSSSFAQKAELFGFSGYTFADKFPISGGEGKIYDCHTYGGSLGINLGDYYQIELSYTRQNSFVDAYSQYLAVDVYEKASVNYIFAGGNRLFPLDENFTVYTGAKLGAFILGFKEDNYDNVSRFAVGVNAGMKYMLSPVAGIRVQGQLYFPITDVGANLWWSPGSGVDVGVSSYTPVLQFGFTGGIFFVLNKSAAE